MDYIRIKLPLGRGRGVVSNWKGHKEGFWNGGNVLFLYLGAGQFLESSLSCTLRICAFFCMHIILNLKVF